MIRLMLLCACDLDLFGKQKSTCELRRFSCRELHGGGKEGHQACCDGSLGDHANLWCRDEHLCGVCGDTCVHRNHFCKFLQHASQPEGALWPIQGRKTALFRVQSCGTLLVFIATCTPPTLIYSLKMMVLPALCPHLFTNSSISYLREAIT